MGQSTQHHRFRFSSVVVLVSARGSASPRADTGEEHCQCFANFSQCAGAQRGCRLAAHRAGSAVACGLAWQTVVFVAPVAHSRCGHPLRGPSGLHKAAFQKVQGSRYAKASLGAPHRCAPPSARPCGWRGTWVLVRRCALRFGQWPAANHVVSAPAHPCASPLRVISPSRWTARPPP